MKEISAAMAKAFSEIEDVKMNKENPFFKSRYADLTAIIHAIKPVLAKHGLFYTQRVYNSDTHAIVETIIHHESGEIIPCGQCAVPMKKNDPQQFGSAFTYARRYSLGAAFGITTNDDDDGNSAAEGHKGDGKPPPPKMTGEEQYNSILSKLSDDHRGYLSTMSKKDVYDFFLEHGGDVVKIISIISDEIKKADEVAK